MRLLHAGYAGHAHRAAARKSFTERGRGARSTHRQSLSLHRLCRHRQSGARCGAAFARRSPSLPRKRGRGSELKMGAKHFGARVTRLEDPALLSGRGRFVDDLKLSGMLHACFVRSPYAHARVHGIDAKAALAMPGVHAVIAANDLPDPMRSAAMPMLLPNPSSSALCTQQVLARAEV